MKMYACELSNLNKLQLRNVNLCQVDTYFFDSMDTRHPLSVNNGQLEGKGGAGINAAYRCSSVNERVEFR